MEMTTWCAEILDEVSAHLGLVRFLEGSVVVGEAWWPLAVSVY